MTAGCPDQSEFWPWAISEIGIHIYRRSCFSERENDNFLETRGKNTQKTQQTDLQSYLCMVGFFEVRMDFSVCAMVCNIDII